MTPKPEETCTDEEARRRAEAMIRAALNTLPTPQKAVAGKGRVPNRKAAAGNAQQPAKDKEWP